MKEKTARCQQMLAATVRAAIVEAMRRPRPVTQINDALWHLNTRVHLALRIICYEAGLDREWTDALDWEPQGPALPVDVERERGLVLR